MIQLSFFFTVHAFVCKVTLDTKGRHCKICFFFSFKINVPVKKEKKEEINKPNKIQGLEKKKIQTQTVLFL